MCKICLKITIKTPERRQWRRSSAFIVEFEHVNANWKINVIIQDFQVLAV